MKTFFAFSFLFIYSFSASGQVYNSSCVPTGNMEALYYNDAYFLALKRLNDANLPEKDSIRIPAPLVTITARALYAIHNMQNAAVRDTIVGVFGYPVFNPYTQYQIDSLHFQQTGVYPNSMFWSNKSLSLVVMNNASWAADWANGNYGNTSSNEINYLINTFNLQVALQPNQVYTDRKFYDVSSAVAINMMALRAKIISISGVADASLNYYYGDGNAVDLQFVNGDAYLTYHLRCGDCPSGCTYGRDWQFKVNTSSDCSVEYLSVSTWGTFLFSIDECLSNYVLPLHINDISVSSVNSGRLLKWTIVSETNVDRYIIERSTDGINFAPVSTKYPTTNQSTLKHYSYADASLMSGNIYYRVKMIETSGNIVYSRIVQINERTKSFIRLRNNLINNGEMVLQFSQAQSGTYIAEIVNSAGQNLFSTKISVTGQAFEKLVQLPSSLSSGAYFVLITGPDTKLSQKIYVEK